MVGRTKSRVNIMSILYQLFLFGRNISMVKDLLENLIESENEFIKEIVSGVFKKSNELDEIANKYLKNWEISRLGTLDQVILKIGIYELLYTDTPDLVCINEAIELSKQYSDEKVTKMINGVLDKIYHNK